MTNNTFLYIEGYRFRRPRKMRQRQGAQIPREACFYAYRSDEGCSATQHMEILRGCHDL